MKKFTTNLFAKRFMGVLATLLLCAWTSTAWAQLPYNTTMTQNHYNNSKVVVGNDGASYSQNKWDNGIHLEAKAGWLTGSEWNWDDKYVIIALAQTSIPYQLKFKYTCNSLIASNANWYVAESSDNSNWSNVWTTESNSISTSDLQTVDLPKSTKYLKFCYSGNYGGTYSDISVSDQAYVNDPTVNDQKITSLDFGTGSISSGTTDLSFDVEWCNVEALSVSVDNTDFFTVTPASFGGKVQYGTQTVTVTYDRDKAVGEHNGTVTMTNGSITKTVTVSGSTTLRPQTIHWNAELEATVFTLNAEDALTGENVATADNEEAEVTFSSSNEDIIAVSPDKKTIVAVTTGTADITVYATGNDIYDAGTDTKTFTVTALKKQSITWEQNLLGLKTNDSPNTVALEATATSGGTITYAIEGGSADCITLGGENNATLTITGTPGEAYIIATQAGGVIGDEEWISATARKQVKVRDPNAACDEYALADQSFSFEKAAGMKQAEFPLTGKPTQLTFYAKYGGKRYLWSEQEPMLIEQYANFGSGLEWKLVESIMPTTSGGNFGPYALEETATKIRFRSGEYGSQDVSNISVPRKKELVVSETTITEDAERNVKWSKTVSVSRSNVDVVDIIVNSDDENCPFTVSKNSIGQDCADRTTETFEIYITPREKNITYTGSVTITDGKANPTTHEIKLSITAIAFNQTISGFDVPETAWTTDVIPAFTATASSGLEVTYSTSDENIARIVNGNELEIITAGEVKVIAYQAGDDKWNEARVEKTIIISKVAAPITTAPTASDLVYGQTLAESTLTGGEAEVDGTFAWEDNIIVPDAGDQTVKVIFTPENDAWYESSSVDVTLHVEKVDAKIISAPRPVLPLAYTGEALVLIHAGEVIGGTMVYSLDGINFSAELPTATEIGEYTVYFRVEGDENHNDVEGGSITATIDASGDVKEVQTITWEQELGNMVYGQTVQLEATCSSEKPVQFEAIVGDEIVWIDEDNILWVINPEATGQIIVRATVEGDETHYAAEPVDKEFYVVATTTPVDETAVQAKAVKIIRNNRLLIIRDGETYNAAGLLVE